MTYEEALPIITELRDHYAEFKDERSIIAEALVAAMDAVSKQIPKKPIEKGCLGKKDKYKYGRCPNPLCNNGVNYEMAYCDNCGQAVDWR